MIVPEAELPRQDSVKLRLFGQVELLDHGQASEVGPPQRRAVLAALAVDAGAPVPAEVLMQRVWGGQPPDGARPALHAHITRLRQVLARCRSAPARLGRGNCGYVLEIDRDQVDLHRTQRLLDCTWESGCDDTRRVALLREVLRIWRGPPLASVPGDWALRVRAGIETQLISAAVAWADAELRLGHTDAAIDKLSQLTSLHPFSEPLAAALMRALCVAGRRAEALQLYAAARVQLREELGVEPGAELNRLHTAVLRDELRHAGPDWAPRMIVSGPAGGTPRNRPRQLPTAATGFTGRQREVTAVERAFAAATRSGSMATVAITGRGGVGKSALAIYAAHRLADRFPDGQLYVDLAGGNQSPPPQPAEVLDRFLGALGVPAKERPCDVTEAAALFRTLTADQRLLVVMDNARSPAQVRQLSPGTSTCGVLLTSRRMLVGLEGVAHIHLDVLLQPEAVEMLAQIVGTARVAVEPAAAAEVACWCDCLPLALCAAGARLAARPGWRIAAIAHRLRDEATRLDELDFAELSVRGSFAASYRELTASADPIDQLARWAFAHLGSWEQSKLSAQDTATLLDRPMAETEKLLERLVDVRLLESIAPNWYQMSGLLRLYAREQLAAGAATAGGGARKEPDRPGGAASSAGQRRRGPLSPPPASPADGPR